MSTANPLVVAPIDTATPFSGAGLLDSGSQLVSAVESGSWVEGGLAGVGVALDVAATVVDPLGSLIGAGIGWIIDHLEPLKGWLNDFTGDAGEVAAFGQTWANVQAQLQASAQELVSVVSQVDQLAGEAMDAYRRFQQDAAEHLYAAASWAGAMSTGLQIASTIVQVVHDLVRDVLSQLAGAIIAWVAELVVTVGLATPVVVAQVTTRVSQLATTVGETVTKVLRSCKNLGKLLDDLKALLQRAGDLFNSVLKGGRSLVHDGVETVAGLPGIRRLDPRRNDLLQNMEDWATNAGIPGYRPWGNLDRTDFLDTHLRNFTPEGYPNWRWPGDDGFDISKPIHPANQVLQPGDVIDRIATRPPHLDRGEFASPPGTGFPTQSLPPDRLNPDFQHYPIEILKPLPPEVRVGNIAPDFQQVGGGVQFHFPGGIDRWVRDGYIREVP